MVHSLLRSNSDHMRQVALERQMLAVSDQRVAKIPVGVPLGDIPVGEMPGPGPGP